MATITIRVDDEIKEEAEVILIEALDG